jgi:transcription initiation factor TFIIIB Brf1 subunit/transcription initiation factor TFIIB
MCPNCGSDNTETYVSERHEYCLDCGCTLVHSAHYWEELEKQYDWSEE